MTKYERVGTQIIKVKRANRPYMSILNKVLLSPTNTVGTPMTIRNPRNQWIVFIAVNLPLSMLDSKPMKNKMGMPNIETVNTIPEINSKFSFLIAIRIQFPQSNNKMPIAG